MMEELLQSDLFAQIKSNGVPVYVLTRKVAPLQQGFYFVNSGMDKAARYLWFYCAFPPSQSKGLGLLSVETGEVTYFPQTQFTGASPYVDPDSGTVYWTVQNSIYRLAPEGQAEPELVNVLPQDFLKGRVLQRLATHLTLSADGKEFFVDGVMGVQWFMGSLPVDGSDFELWHMFQRNYNHAQFSPTDPALVLFAEEDHRDPITGLIYPITNRMWLIRRGEQPEPIFREPTRVSHEWWDADGEHVWCVRGNATWRTNIRTREVEKFQGPAHCWHSHTSKDHKYIVHDSNEGFHRGCASSLWFRNLELANDLKIIEHPDVSGTIAAEYHIDPHPRFCAEDKYVTFTTLYQGEFTVALIKTEDLISAASCPSDRSCRVAE